MAALKHPSIHPPALRSTAIPLSCCEEYRPPPPQLLGLDYLVDTQLHPWLLEVNGTPSLAVEHENPDVEGLISKQKVGETESSLGWIS